MEVCVGNVDLLSPAQRAGLKKGMIIDRVRIKYVQLILYIAFNIYQR